MRIAVMGSGGLGGFFGGAFARAGLDVTFVARGAQLAALRANGLTVKSAQLGDFAQPVWATDDPSEIEPVDLVLFSVKAYDLDSAAEQMLPLVGPKTMILPILNGIDIAIRLGQYVLPQQILGGISYVSARVESPGVVEHAGGSQLLFGELAGNTSPRVERLLEALQPTVLEIQLRTSIREDLWVKFASICAGSITTLTRQSVGEILATEAGRELYLGTMQEAAAVGRSMGARLPPESIEACLDMIQEMPGLRSSQYYDLVAGRRLELDGLNGAVVRQGRKYGVSTPFNLAVYVGLKPFADGAPGTA